MTVDVKYRAVASGEGRTGPVRATDGQLTITMPVLGNWAEPGPAMTQGSWSRSAVQSATSVPSAGW
jgi:hypothetical protein